MKKKKQKKERGSCYRLNETYKIYQQIQYVNFVGILIQTNHVKRHF